MNWQHRWDLIKLMMPEVDSKVKEFCVCLHLEHLSNSRKPRHITKASNFFYLSIAMKYKGVQLSCSDCHEIEGTGKIATSVSAFWHSTTTESVGCWSIPQSNERTFKKKGKNVFVVLPRAESLMYHSSWFYLSMMLTRWLLRIYVLPQTVWATALIIEVLIRKLAMAATKAMWGIQTKATLDHLRKANASSNSTRLCFKLRNLLS